MVEVKRASQRQKFEQLLEGGAQQSQINLHWRVQQCLCPTKVRFGYVTSLDDLILGTFIL